VHPVVIPIWTHQRPYTTWARARSWQARYAARTQQGAYMSVDPRLRGYLVAEQGDKMCLAIDCDIDIDAYISLRDRDFEGEYE